MHLKRLSSWTERIVRLAVAGNLLFSAAGLPLATPPYVNLT